MKNSKEMADSVFRIRDTYLEKQRKRKIRLKKAAYIGSSVCMLGLIVAGINFMFPNIQQLPDITASDSSENTLSSSVSESETNNTHKDNEMMPADGTSQELEVQEDPDELIETESERTQEEIVTSTDVIDGGSIEEIIFPPFEWEENIPPHDESIDEAEDESESIVIDPNGFDTWSLDDVCRSFPEISFEKKYHCADIAIGEEMLGSAIADITITGYDIDTERSIFADAVVYSFIGSDENDEVAVWFKGRNDYIVYRAE